MLGWLAHPVANVDRRWRRLLAALLATVCAVAVAPSFVVAAPPTTTLTFDELSTRPVNGVQVAGVSFDFRVGGAASSDATYGAFGPGSTTYVQDPSLEGTTAGALTLRFSHPTTVLEFGLALSSTATLTPGATIELYKPGGHLRAVRTLTTQSLISFTERFTYQGGAIGSARITSSPLADRFALDNLTFRALPPGQLRSGAATTARGADELAEVGGAARPVSRGRLYGTLHPFHVARLSDLPRWGHARGHTIRSADPRGTGPCRLPGEAREL